MGAIVLSLASPMPRFPLMAPAPNSEVYAGFVLPCCEGADRLRETVSQTSKERYGDMAGVCAIALGLVPSIECSGLRSWR